jgi:hypothetical protein
VLAPNQRDTAKFHVIRIAFVAKRRRHRWRQSKPPASRKSYPHAGVHPIPLTQNRARPGETAAGRSHRNSTCEFSDTHRSRNSAKANHVSTQVLRDTGIAGTGVTVRQPPHPARSPLRSHAGCRCCTAARSHVRFLATSHSCTAWMPSAPKVCVTTSIVVARSCSWSTMCRATSAPIAQGP